MHLIDNIFCSEHFIFIKDNLKLSDNDLLIKLNLKNYHLVSSKKELQKGGESPNKRYLYITEDEKWKHLMDDSLCSLWHKKEVQNQIKLLSKEFDVFCCSIGMEERHDSFDFVYFKNGKEQRKIIMDTLKLNQSEDPFDNIPIAAKLLGINVKHDLERIRCYGRPEEKSEKFIFNEDEY